MQGICGPTADVKAALKRDLAIDAALCLDHCEGLQVWLLLGSGQISTVHDNVIHAIAPPPHYRAHYGVKTELNMFTYRKHTPLSRSIFPDTAFLDCNPEQALKELYPVKPDEIRISPLNYPP